MKKLRKDLDALLKDIENYIVEKGQNQFLNPLRYRLGLLQEKFEKLQPVFSSNDTRKVEEDLRFANAILN
jgi:hypothetical protein